MASHARLSALLRPLAEAIRPPAEVRRALRVEGAITGDGRPRLDRAAGALPRHVLVPTSAASAIAEPTDVSPAANAQDQLQDIAEALVANAVTAVDTGSVDMTIAPNGTNLDVSAEVKYGGSGGDFGTAETAARSDHLHDGRYYTEAEVDAGFSAVGHDHDADYLPLAGGALAGPLAVTTDGVTAFVVETSGGDDVLRVGTGTPQVRVQGTSATALLVRDGTGAAVVVVDTVNAELEVLGAVVFGGGKASAPSVRTGAGSPEGAVAAVVGSLYLRTDGGATTTLYVKTSGTGNTGWTAK